MKCVFDSYTDYTAGKIPGADEVFDNFPAITGKQPRTLADFAKAHADKFLSSQIQTPTGASAMTTRSLLLESCEEE
jgi:hypothetical protein